MAMKSALCICVCVDIIYLLNGLLYHYCKCYKFTIKPLLQVRKELMLCTAVISSACCISPPPRAGTLAAFFPKTVLGFVIFLVLFFFFLSNVNNNRCSLRLHPMQRSFWGLISLRLGISHTRLLL